MLRHLFRERHSTLADVSVHRAATMVGTVDFDGQHEKQVWAAAKKAVKAAGGKWYEAKVVGLDEMSWIKTWRGLVVQSNYRLSQ